MKRADAPYVNGLRVSLYGGELYIDVRVGPAQYCVDMKADTFDAALIAIALTVLNANCRGRVVAIDEVRERLDSVQSLTSGLARPGQPAVTLSLWQI